MSQQTETPKRASYEAPRLTVVELRPEEMLIICTKVPGPCAVMAMTS